MKKLAMKNLKNKIYMFQFSLPDNRPCIRWTKQDIQPGTQKAGYPVQPNIFFIVGFPISAAKCEAEAPHSAFKISYISEVYTSDDDF